MCIVPPSYLLMRVLMRLSLMIKKFLFLGATDGQATLESCIVCLIILCHSLRNFAVAGAKIWNSLPTDLRLHTQSM